MEILNVTDEQFRDYGRVLKNYDTAALIKVMEHTPLPQGEVVYEPSIGELETLDIAEKFKDAAYGGMPVQVGYCNGYNKKLNALEYHRSSELNVAVTDMILLLGRQQDIQDDFTYDTSLVKAFLVPSGTVIEVYATTLHYAPCMTDENGFRCTVVLPKGTNTDGFVAGTQGEGKLLTAVNKWLIAHEDAKIEGAFCGLRGANLSV